MSAAHKASKSRSPEEAFLRYRTDIDGLRAIAVMAVVIFHAGLETLGGGYLGVDIFYVISGFLITSIIQREIAEGEFSLIGFYRRRIVRILPALFTMLLVVLAVACFIAMPPDIAAIGKSSAAAAGFVANMHFWQTTGYFDAAAEAAPLLHTWSLGVEEQFYILFPLLLMALARWGRRPTGALLVLCIVSFALALWFGTWRDGSDFYLLPTRAWQLGLGALVATGFFPAVRGRAGLGLATLGLAAICASFFIGEAFTVTVALLTSAGAVLVIAYGEGTLLHKMLALPPVRWLGAISYSLYLWHWPIITYYRLSYGLDLTPVEEVALVAGSIAAAALSYYLVEQPMLRRYRTADPRRTVIVGAIAVVAMIGVSLAVAARSHAWRAMPSEVVRVSSYVDYADRDQFKRQSRSGVCLISSLDHDYDEEECAALSPTGRNIALIGDSHAAHYWRSLAKRFPDDNIIQATGAGCPMLLNSLGLERCKEVHRFAYGPLIERGQLDHVILADRWTRNHVPQLKKTIAYLRARGLPVTVIGPSAEYNTRFPVALGRAMETDNWRQIDRLKRPEIAGVDRLIRKVAAEAGADYYSVYDAECPDERCIHFAPHDGVPIHFDYGHVTESGADFLLRNLHLR